MARKHFSSEIENGACVFYVPEAKAFWTGKKKPPGPLRKATVYFFRLPEPPPGAVCMLRRRARQMLDRGHQERFWAYVLVDEPGGCAPRSREEFDAVHAADHGGW